MRGNEPSFPAALHRTAPMRGRRANVRFRPSAREMNERTQVAASETRCCEISKRCRGLPREEERKKKEKRRERERERGKKDEKAAEQNAGKSSHCAEIARITAATRDT